VHILLVEPRTPDTFWSLRHALRFVGRRAANPPLDMLTMAGLLPREWNYRLVDLNARKLGKGDLAWADRVLVSAMEVHRDGVKELARQCHAAGKSLIGGGPLFRDDATDDLGVDHVVIGEAGETAPRLVRDMTSGRLQPS
jgi:hypothetical protein